MNTDGPQDEEPELKLEVCAITGDPVYTWYCVIDGKRKVSQSFNTYGSARDAKRENKLDWEEE